MTNGHKHGASVSNILASLICLIFSASTPTLFGAEATTDLAVRVFYTANTLPFVLAARQVNLDLKLHASPWSPPAWMKKSGKMDRGGKDSRLRDEDAIYAAYGLYFERYITGYLAHGIPIAWLLPQNEMDCNPAYPGNVMEPPDTIRLVTQHLVPRFKASKIATEIRAGTFREKPAELWATECMKNPAFCASIAGLGIQYFNGRSIEALSKDYPSLRYMHTEASCGNGKNVAD